MQTFALMSTKLTYIVNVRNAGCFAYHATSWWQ